MIKTTRIKYSQSPRVIVDDLTEQCDGERQTFSLKKAVPEYAPYCMIYNGQVYTNTSYKEWFVLSADRKTITTSFPVPPKQGINKSLILVVGVAGSEELTADWVTMINKPEFAEVSFSGSYNDLKDKPGDYELPVATETVLGGVKIGAGLKVSDQGTISVDSGGEADSVNWANVIDKPNFAAVSTSGSYNDLNNKPTIPTTSGIQGMIDTSLSNYYTKQEVDSSKVNISMTDVDPGEGVDLAENHFIGVYN